MSFQGIPVPRPRKRILKVARDAFLEAGFTRVSMDQIAYRLGMSKRTLYKHFANKQELLREALLDRVRRIGSELELIVDDEQWDFTEKLRLLVVCLTKSLPRPSNAVLEDMRRSGGDVWDEIDALRIELLKDRFSRLLRQGVKEGLVKEELELDLMVMMIGAVVQNVATPENVAQVPLTLGQFLTRLVDLILRGMLTPKGQRAYSEKAPAARIHLDTESDRASRKARRDKLN